MKKINAMLLVGIVFIAGIASSAGPEKPREKAASKATTVQIKDKPMTFCNPLTITGARRAGEPIVLIFKDSYYL
jgi:hypothetical protein